MLEVRAARHGDAPALDALGAAPEAGVFVLEKNGAVIGALTLRAGEIFGCAVAPEWRGRGYGTFLLRRRCAPPGRGRFVLKRRRAMPRWRRCCAGAGFAHRSGIARREEEPARARKPALLPAL
ncbi:MAG: GNAT family N-acetyltransferase [Ruthenibacterium lactatiformans]|uniref:GNAT family N-acetyltransferase n=1 Tax=Ruthenibacterium lactatiformans TaxID=1550024 RepID=UPI0039960EF9